jgi:hypothetical protein
VHESAAEVHQALAATAPVLDSTEEQRKRGHADVVHPIDVPLLAAPAVLNAILSQVGAD